MDDASWEQCIVVTLGTVDLARQFTMQSMPTAKYMLQSTRSVMASVPRAMRPGTPKCNTQCMVQLGSRHGIGCDTRQWQAFLIPELLAH